MASTFNSTQDDLHREIERLKHDKHIVYGAIALLADRIESAGSHEREVLHDLCDGLQDELSDILDPMLTELEQAIHHQGER